MPTSKPAKSTNRIACICKTATRLPAAVLCLLVLAGCITDISVARHPSVALSDAEAEAILADFSLVVSQSDAQGDFACASEGAGQFLPAIYRIDGNVGVHNGPSTINSQADLTAVLNEPGYAKVVSAINWCGDFGPNIIGCAPIPGNSFAVVRRSAGLEGILWAHEFGHTVGLSHRSDSFAVMRGTIGTNNRSITRDECEQFLEKVNPDYYQPPGSNAASEPAASDGPTTVDGALPSQIAPSNSLLEFVRKVYPHGTPMSELVGMEPGESLPALRAMLWDEEESLYWGNVVVALGLFGDASDVASIIAFINQQASAQDDGLGEGNARAGLMALGYLANRTGDQGALNFLAGAMTPQAWQATADVQEQLATAAHIGMAFSGQRLLRSRAARSTTVVSSSLDQALQAVSDDFASKGVRGYYKDR